MPGSEREWRARGGRSGSLVASHASRKEAAPAFSTGINPLFGSEVAPMSSSGDDNGALKSRQSPSSSGTPPATAERRSTTNAAAAAGPAAKAATAALAAKQKQQQRSGESTPMARRKRGTSPQSTLTTSTTQSDSSRRVRPVVAPTPQVVASTGTGRTLTSSRSAPASRNGSINKGSSNKRDDFVPAPLVPALLAPVPPPPPKRRSVAADIETGEEVQSGEELEDAPDKTLMEMLQTYLKKQDLYTRMVLVVVLLVLAGGVLGAYALMVFYAIDKKEPKYIVVVSIISVVLGWVLWRVSQSVCLWSFFVLRERAECVLIPFGLP